MPVSLPRLRPALVLLASVFLLLQSLALTAVSPAAADVAGESLEVQVDAPRELLLGQAGEVTVTARNNGDTDEYNLSFRYELPSGVEYVAGSSNELTELGEPDAFTAPDGRTVLVWRNVSDLPVGGEQQMRFRVSTDTGVLPVGSEFSGSAAAYANADERTVPRFDSEGTHTGGATVQDGADAGTTTITAIEVTKHEPSPEHELVRGVHTHPTTYTLEVTNNDHYANNNVVLVDYLPAQLEFLACGDVDHTADGVVEYEGAPRLDAMADVAADCVAPISVTTVTDPDGLPAGVYTRVEWHLGPLAAGEDATVAYAAGIPQRANTADFGGETPSGESLRQGANLDNNNGPSTRETATEQALTNHAEVSADFTGPVADGASAAVTDTDELTVTSEDLAIQKSVSPGTFRHGGVASYTLSLQTGEYATADGTVVTDELPDGLCPIGAGLSSCPADGEPGPSVPFDSVTANPDGSYTVVFEPIAMDASDELTITYQARMLSTYREDDVPTVAGDSFTNEVSLTAETTTLESVEAPDHGTLTVQDDSRARIEGQTVQLDKRILPDDGTGIYECTDDPADYVESEDADPATITFNEGSRVCFLLEVTFPDGVDTKNPELADFLPEDLTFEAGRALPSNEVAFDVVDDLTFLLGTETGGARFVSKASVFRYVVSATVDSPAEPGQVDVPGNLAKLRWTNTAGRVSFLRDQVDFQIPPVAGTIEKSASQEEVRAGDVVDFTVTVGNDGDSDIVGPDVWDRLPAGIECDDVQAISHGGSCTDPGDPGHPPFHGNAERSAIRWDLPDTTRIAPGGTLELSYQVTYPATIAADAAYRNDVDIASYGTETNIGTVVPHYPADNVDTTVDPDDIDAPRAHDNETVRTPDTSIDKSNVTEVDDTTQSTGAGSYVAIGETVTYTVSATFPANTTIYNGIAYDVLPDHLRFEGVTYAFSTDDGATWTALPTGSTHESDEARFALPASYEVDGTADVLEMTITATVIADGADPRHGDTLTNTAHLTSTDQFGDNPTDRSATSDVTAVHPSPSPLKWAGDEGVEEIPQTDQDITYTVTARNVDPADPGQLRPTLYDGRLVDCVPVGLALDTGSLNASVGSVTVADPATYGCATDATAIVWDVGDLAWRAPGDLAGNPWPTLTYVVTVDPAAGGGASYTNTVTQTGTSMAGAHPDERTYQDSTTETVTAPGGQLTKTVTPERAPVGDTVEYTITAQVPALINLYDATIIDQLPTGIDTDSVEVSSVDWNYTDAGPGEPSGLPAHTPLTPLDNAHGWYLGDIPSDARPREVVIVYTAVIDAQEDTNTAGTARINSAHLAWNSTDEITDGSTPGPDADFEQESAPGTATVTVQEPDLSIAKTVDNANPEAGEQFTYTITVANDAGPNSSTAHGIDITDDIPAGVRVDPSTISPAGVFTGAGPDGGGGTITWTGLPALAPGAAPLELTYSAVLVSPVPSTDQTNTADITEYTSLPGDEGRVYDGPEDSATVTPAVPVLEITKTLLDPAPSYRGLPVRWQLEVVNTGDATAYEVDVTDTLPADWSYDDDSARVSIAGGAATAVEPVDDTGELTWTDLGDLGEGETLLVVFTATPGAGAPVGGDVEHLNTATTNGKDLPDGEVVTTDDDDAATRIDSADLVIDKVAQGTPVAGAEFSWELTVRNEGDDPAAGPITVTDTLPLGVTGVAASGTGWLVTITAGTADTPATVTATRSDNLDPDESYPPITVSADLPADLAPESEITNAAGVESPTYDPDEDNNEDEVTSEVTTVSDYGIAKALTGSLVPGQQATYTIDVTNHGPSYSRGPITVTDTLPAGLTYDSFTGTDWSLDSSDDDELVFVWSGATPVAPGALPQITITVDVAASLTTAVTNSVEVSEPTDPTSGPEEPDSDEVTSTPVPSADLALQKSHSGTFGAGEQGRYEFVVTNHGPSDAAGPVRITDTLPDSLTYADVESTDAWSCSASGQELTCELPGGLTAAKASTSLVVTVDIDEALTGNVVNTATVSSPTDDPHPANNESTDDTDIDVEADLGIVKELVTDPVIAGEQLAYELTVTNHGPATSPGTIAVVDTLPAGLTAVDATGAGWVCDADGGTVECDRAAALNAGASAPVITVIAEAASGIGTVNLVNIASVSGPATDPEPDNNTDEAPTSVTEDTELTIAKTTTGADPVRAGEQTSFEITVSNTGSSDARNVVVEDLLPSGMTLVSLDGDGWDCDDLTCERDRIVAGTAAPVLTVVAEVASGTADGTVLVNQADVTTSTPGDDPADNSAEADVTVVAEADLVVAKQHTGDEVGYAVAGTSTTYQVTVTNGGPSDAVGPLTVTDELPEGMSFLSAGAPWTCVTGTGRVVTCTLPGGLPAGQTAAVLDLQVQLEADLDDGPITNTAEVSSPTVDPDPANNDDDEDVVVEREADVSVTKSHTGPVRIGDELVFTLQVGNDGPSEARDVAVVDTLPDGLQPLSADGTGWNCSIVANELTCLLTGPLAPDSQAAPITVTTTVLPEAYPEVVNTAEVNTSSPDPVPSNNTTTDTVDVPAQVDLAVEKSLDGELVVGEHGTYQFVVTNHGPTSAPGPITVTDLLPAGLTFESSDGADWSCTAVDSTVTCVHDDALAVGADTAFGIQVLVAPSAWPEVSNTVTVGSASEDIDPDNDRDLVTSPVTPTVDLEIDKSVESREGRRVTYLLEVTNQGPSDSVGQITVRDDLPAELELVRTSGDGWACDTSRSGAECTYDAVLPAGDSVQLLVVTDLVGSPDTEIVNVASVSGGGDVDTATDQVAIDPEPGDLPSTGGSSPWLLPLGGLLLALGVWAASRRRASTR